MASDKPKVLRCAIYTRKSTEHGLEQEFNSLDAQREACEAYIKSQASTGWRLHPARYDDPAYSGGNLKRPALRKLLKDIEAGLVDVVVVYKIDRLTRALADFAKLVELFDTHSVSFVAVTQQFNTTTSMGRLTLNVLLSFAQFERELSSERVRDKIAASRRKGKWTGGSVPLGYDSVGKKLVINDREAGIVRTIFSRYLDLKSIHALVHDCKKRKLTTKARLVNGKASGAGPFAYGPLAYLLKNRTYLGEVGHHGKWFEGEHEPIVERAVFEQVQATLKNNNVARSRKRSDHRALLAGLLFDDRGNHMSASYTVKRGVRYPFYVSAALLQGRKADAGSVTRVPAIEIETAIVDALRRNPKATIENEAADPTTLATGLVDRIIVGGGKLMITLKTRQRPIELPWATRKVANPIRILDGDDASGRAPKQELIQAIVRAHTWLKALTDGTHSSIESLARAANVHPKVLRGGIRLAFLAPDITEAILNGDQSHHLTVSDFQRAIPLAWKAQRSVIQAADRG